MMAGYDDVCRLLREACGDGIYPNWHHMEAMISWVQQNIDKGRAMQIRLHGVDEIGERCRVTAIVDGLSHGALYDDVPLAVAALIAQIHMSRKKVQP